MVEEGSAEQSVSRRRIFTLASMESLLPSLGSLFGSGKQGSSFGELSRLKAETLGLLASLSDPFQPVLVDPQGHELRFLDPTGQSSLVFTLKNTRRDPQVDELYGHGARDAIASSIPVEHKWLSRTQAFTELPSPISFSEVEHGLSTGSEISFLDFFSPKVLLGEENRLQKEWQQALLWVLRIVTSALVSVSRRAGRHLQSVPLMQHRFYEAHTNVPPPLCALSGL